MALAVANDVATPIGRHFQKPVSPMVVAFEGDRTLVERDERILSDVIGLIGGAEHAAREAVHRILMGGNRLCYVPRVANGSLPSSIAPSIAAARRPGEKISKKVGKSCKEKGFCGV